jgi:hypothetical protein
MYDFLDPEEFRPPQEILDQCVSVLITDIDLKDTPHKIKHWCLENCKSFVFMDETDVSDVSYQWDYIYAFYFGEQDDANWFTLRWR